MCGQMCVCGQVCSVVDKRNVFCGFVDLWMWMYEEEEEKRAAQCVLFCFPSFLKGKWQLGGQGGRCANVGCALL